MFGFSDETYIDIASGSGGNGCVSFRREKFVAKGGPDGGDGGRGGDVVFVVKDNLRTLVHLKRVRSYRAENGRDGQGRRNFGRKGADIEIPVPPGTVIKDATTGEIIKDLEGLERYVFLKGGNGGRGNWHFRSPTRQAPRYAQQGEKGVAMRIGVELLIIADIGFVGFPNAGKSSLLNNLTNARTKVAGYPFTTKIPQLGMFRYGNNDIVLADIPGIIEGASQGAGMGLKFLRHISRTVALAFLIDLGDERYATTLETLQGEIGEYAPELLEKPYVVIGTKIDLEGARERLAELQTKHPTIGLSNTSTEGLEEVKQAFIKLVDVEGREVDDGFTTSVDLDAHYREEP
ncbi:MAG: GTPase ObgE [Sphaerochaetaceae bacterium]|jgi:GTP-binding protein|nr:GTPase ObgE [Sphaerochaetaceae bacterium]HHU88786.1 GTPase ObgE [Spirochaetales bacterium]